MAASQRALRTHAAHLKYGRDWERMAEDVSEWARKHDIDLSRSDLALQEIATLLCEIKYNPYYVDEDYHLYS